MKSSNFKKGLSMAWLLVKTNKQKKPQTKNQTITQIHKNAVLKSLYLQRDIFMHHWDANV